jgi:hypothetical protein
MGERRRSGETVRQRRRAPRTPLRTLVTCLIGGESFIAITTDLSAAGCFLETETPAPKNAVVELTLHLADDPEPAKASGRVVRVHRREDEWLGFSVEFDCIDDATCSRIDRLVERALLELSGDPQKP